MKSFARQLVLPFLKIYWKIFKPSTYGAKLLLREMNGESDVFLLVRHTYGNQSLWSLPGGGYSPKKESPLEAAEREAREELSLNLIEPKIIGLYTTNAQGKKDSVSIIYASVEKSNLKKNSEIAEVQWKNRAQIQNDPDTARIVRFAINLL